jgi:hypothetical protein
VTSSSVALFPPVNKIEQKSISFAKNHCSCHSVLGRRGLGVRSLPLVHPIDDLRLRVLRCYTAPKLEIAKVFSGKGVADRTLSKRPQLLDPQAIYAMKASHFHWPFVAPNDALPRATAQTGFRSSPPMPK